MSVRVLLTVTVDDAGALTVEGADVLDAPSREIAETIAARVRATLHRKGRKFRVNVKAPGRARALPRLEVIR